jgi:hypothetical protein
LWPGDDNAASSTSCIDRFRGLEEGDAGNDGCGGRGDTLILDSIEAGVGEQVKATVVKGSETRDQQQVFLVDSNRQTSRESAW